MYEHFTDGARLAMQNANQEALRLNHQYIGTEHILLGLVNQCSSVVAAVLRVFNLDPKKIHLEIEKVVYAGPDMVAACKLPQTPRAKKVIEYAMVAARHLNHNYIGAEHLLLGLMGEKEGIAAQILTQLGLTQEKTEEALLCVLTAEEQLQQLQEGLYFLQPVSMSVGSKDISQSALRRRLNELLDRSGDIVHIIVKVGPKPKET